MTFEEFKQKYADLPVRKKLDMLMEIEEIIGDKRVMASQSSVRVIHESYLLEVVELQKKASWLFDEIDKVLKEEK